MSPDQLLAILDDFISGTDARLQQSLVELKAVKGEVAPVVPQPALLRQWRRDLPARPLFALLAGAAGLGRELPPARHPVSRCNPDPGLAGSVPSFFQQGEWIPAVVNLTCLADPAQVGSGWSGLNTLFHEGARRALCRCHRQRALLLLSQEFPPTSMAYAETWSMFCDSLLDDADWLKRYARNSAGEAIPDALIKEMIAARQPFRVFNERQLALVAYFERDLYAMPVERAHAHCWPFRISLIRSRPAPITATCWH